MSRKDTILLLEDEPLILLDLEFAAEDADCEAFTATNCEDALAIIVSKGPLIDTAVLDVSLGGSTTCVPVARELERQRIPYILHTGDLDRQDERLCSLGAQVMAKPTIASQVIAEAIAHARRQTLADSETDKIAAK